MRADGASSSATSLHFWRPQIPPTPPRNVAMAPRMLLDGEPVNRRSFSRFPGSPMRLAVDMVRRAPAPTSRLVFAEFRTFLPTPSGGRGGGRWGGVAPRNRPRSEPAGRQICAPVSLSTQWGLSLGDRGGRPENQAARVGGQSHRAPRSSGDRRIRLPRSSPRKGNPVIGALLESTKVGEYDGPSARMAPASGAPDLWLAD